jgi:hypothetical protein
VSIVVVSLTPAQSLGIPVALVGSVFLAVGAELQQHGVTKAGEAAASHGRSDPRSSGLGWGQLTALARRPSWLIGTLMLGLSTVFQLFSLYLAPLTVVQPLGAIALVVTALITARLTRIRLKLPAIRAILYCIGGVGLFVAVAALTTTTIPIAAAQLLIVAIILAAVLLLFGLGFVLFRARFTRLFYIAGAGVLFGFVATLAKVLITRVQTIIDNGLRLSPADWLTIVCLAGFIAAAVLGSYFVQIAYASGSPELVVAGLTVIDPLVGVSIGIIVLGEAAGAPLWADIVFFIAGALAVYGVIQLSRHQPQAASMPRAGSSGGLV